MRDRMTRTSIKQSKKNKHFECKQCEYYNVDDDNCSAFECDPFDCDFNLPCEDTDGLTLYVEGSKHEKNNNRGFDCS